MKYIIFYVITLFLISSCSNPVSDKPVQKTQDEIDTLCSLNNDKATLTIDLYGGAYVDFHLNDNNVNPLTWKTSKDDMPVNNRYGASFQGHFLCLGRWGQPTPGEIEAGVPHNGQATNTMWTKEKTNNEQKIIMSNYAPRDGISIMRTVQLSNTDAIYYVKEEVKNVTSIMRINNIVQHATLGPPFLDTNTILNSNAWTGFNQELDLPDPHAYEKKWPFAYSKDKNSLINIQNTSNNKNYCCSFIFNSDYGWATACNPSKKLLIGYIWKTSEYPWLNIWQHVKDGKPIAKAIEFGTTGIGEPYTKILMKDTRFHSHNSFEILDAGQTVTKHFACFLLKIPNNFRGVESIMTKNNMLKIKEKPEANKTCRQFELPFKAL